MIKYSMLWVINSIINLPCHLPVNEKWKLRECGKRNNVKHVRIFACNVIFGFLERGNYTPSTSYSFVSRLLYFFLIFLHLITTSRQQGQREEAQSKEGKGKMADERKGMMETGKVSSEVRRS